MEPSPITVIITENQEIVEKLQNDPGTFLVERTLGVPLLSFKPTEDDEEIERFLQNETFQGHFKSLESTNRSYTPHPKESIFTWILVSLLAQGCSEVFGPRLKSERIPKDSKFFRRDFGLESDRAAHSILTLGQKGGDLKIPLLLCKEFMGFDNLLEKTPGLSKYAKKTFAQEISIGEEKLSFESAYVLVVSKLQKQVKLIHYTRPPEDLILSTHVKTTIEFDLFKNGTCDFKIKNVQDLFRVLFNCVFLQLKSLDLIK